jgi:hypothetical protein
MRGRVLVAVMAFGFVVVPTVPVLACAALIGPRGTVNLTRTATLAAHHNGIEHYVTAFNYAGGGGKFGSIIPLPGMPTKVEKGGGWTLQRLQRETAPPEPQLRFAAASTASGDKAQEVYKTRIDALDITVLKGGGASIREWAAQHGFKLSPDSPVVFDFYARRSPYFMAAVFDTTKAEERGQQVGDGTPIHITIPMSNPWVPLRVLGLGKDPRDSIDADVYLLTDRIPNLLPAAGRGYTLERQGPASRQLLADLRSDRGMGWMPASGMTLTHLIVSSNNKQLRYDLATNVHGGKPSAWRAGLAPLSTPTPTPAPTPRPTPVPTPTAAPIAIAVARAAQARPVWPFAAGALVVALAGAAVWVLRVRGSTSR